MHENTANAHYPPSIYFTSTNKVGHQTAYVVANHSLRLTHNASTSILVYELVKFYLFAGHLVTAFCLLYGGSVDTEKKRVSNVIRLL